MPRRRDDDSDDEFDLPDGVYHDDDELPTVPCPYCRAELLEDAVRCPRCENYLSREDAPTARRSGFFYAMMAAALACVLWWLLAM